MKTAIQPEIYEGEVVCAVFGFPVGWKHLVVCCRTW